MKVKIIKAVNFSFNGYEIKKLTEGQIIDINEDHCSHLFELGACELVSETKEQVIEPETKEDKTIANRSTKGNKRGKRIPEDN